MSDQIYKLPYKCDNCEVVRDLEIPFGTEAPDVGKCSNCGCVKARRHNPLANISPYLPYQPPSTQWVPFPWPTYPQPPFTITNEPQPYAEIWCDLSRNTTMVGSSR